MEITLRILLGLVTLICLLGGLNLLTKGAGSFLPEFHRDDLSGGLYFIQLTEDNRVISSKKFIISE